MDRPEEKAVSPFRVALPLLTALSVTLARKVPGVDKGFVSTLALLHDIDLLPLGHTLRYQSGAFAEGRGRPRLELSGTSARNFTTAKACLSAKAAIGRKFAGPEVRASVVGAGWNAVP